MPKQTVNMTTREKLLAHAVKLFLKKGYDKTTTKDIAKAVGIQAPGIYHYFKSKKNILTELNEESWQKFRQMILDRAEEIDDPEERIKLYIRNMIKYQFELGQKTLILDDSVSIKNVVGRKSYEKQVFRFLRDNLQQLAEKRGIKNPIDPSLAAFSLYPMVARVYQWYKPKGHMSLEDLSEQIIRLFMEGFIGSKDKSGVNNSSTGKGA